MACAGLAWLLALGTAQAAYTLSSEDRLKIRVHEWRSSLGEVHEWTAFNGEFTIGIGGTLSLPLIGELRAEGLTSEQVAQAISRALQDKVGLRTVPDTSVEVVQFRPFYILGKVAKPGAYPFKPGLTVLQSVSLAGGMDKAGEFGLLRLERELITSRSNLKVLALSIDTQLARRARLQAELDNSAEIAFPQELLRRKDQATVKMINEERMLFETRREALRGQVETLTSLKQNLKKEIESLKAKVVLKNRQLELLQREVKNVTSLVQRGLAIESRQFALERAEADAEGNRLDLDTAILRALQELSRTDRLILDLQNTFRTAVIADLQSTQAKLEEQWEQADMTQKLMSDSELAAEQLGTDLNRNDTVSPIYTIARRAGDGVVETIGSESSPVEPGDIIKVRLPSLPTEDGRAVDYPTPRSMNLIGRREAGAVAPVRLPSN
jgi:polysaccharide export outer membrane protein/exopolysaccharide production protein ExoF